MLNFKWNECSLKERQCTNLIRDRGSKMGIYDAPGTCEIAEGI